MNHKKRFSVKGISIIIILCLSCFSAIIIWYQYIIRSIKHEKNNSIQIVTDKCYDEFTAYYKYFSTQAKLESSIISSDIKDEIFRTYNDLSVLKNELNDNKYSEKLMRIFKRNIDNKYLNNIESANNGVIIANYDGIILDYRYDIDNPKVCRTWDEEEKRQINKSLYKKSIQNILEQNTSEIIVQQRDGIVQYKNFTIDTIKEIYYNEGIEGFKNYIFLVPTYIYNHEDIFGTSDIFNGRKIKNNKLIVIQEFNLYDQIKNLSDSVITDKSIDKSKDIYDKEFTQLYSLGIALIISVIGLIVGLCLIYNYQMGEIRKGYKSN